MLVPVNSKSGSIDIEGVTREQPTQAYFLASRGGKGHCGVRIFLSPPRVILEVASLPLKTRAVTLNARSFDS